MDNKVLQIKQFLTASFLAFAVVFAYQGWVNFTLYHTPFDQILRTTNQAFATAGTFLIGCSMIGSIFKLSEAVKKWYGIIGVMFMINHVFLSYILFDPKWYVAGPYQWFIAAQIMMITGVVSLMMFLSMLWTSDPTIRLNLTVPVWDYVQSFMMIALSLGLVHAVIMNVPDYLSWAHWEKTHWIPEAKFLLVLVLVPIMITRSIQKLMRRKQDG